MSGPLRVGGRARLPDGRETVWSVAEGSRGSRWRESVSSGGSLLRSLLVETSPAGRVSRLEMTSAAGLLTLHPDRDARELHGNVVTPAGICHLRFDWSLEHELLVDGSPVAAAIALRRLGEVLPVGETRPVEVIRIDDALEPRPDAWRVTRRGPTDWDLDGSGTEVRRAVRLDATGLPILPGAETWPLERD